MNINENLKSLRKGKTQKQVAKELNISYASYNKYETTNTMPDIENLINIANYYKITLDALVGHNVPYLLDKSVLTPKQRQLVEMVCNLDDNLCDLVRAYIQGNKDAKN